MPKVDFLRRTGTLAKFGKKFEIFDFFWTDAKKTAHSESVNFFGLCPNFLAKNDRKVKFGKNVRLGSKSMKKVFGRNFCHFRAPWDPTKYRKSQKNGVFLRFRVPIGENRPFLVRNFCAPTFTTFLSEN